jgi:hypothetical protein
MTKDLSEQAGDVIETVVFWCVLPALLARQAWRSLMRRDD